MQRSSFRLSRSFQTVVYLTFGLVLITGAGWMIEQSQLEQTNNREMSVLLMRIHGGAAMAILVVLGALTPHIKRAWKAGKNRMTGVCIVTLNLFLVVSGYGLYYAGDENLRSSLSRWHGWIGLTIMVILPTHIAAGRLIVRRSRLRKMQPQRAGKIVRQPQADVTMNKVD